MFGIRKKKRQPVYDWTGKVPVIRSSICTGEQTAGFKDEASGRFEEVMLIRNDADYQEFLRQYGVTEDQIRREY